MKKTMLCILACLALTTSVFAAPTVIMEGTKNHGGISYNDHHISWDGNGVGQTGSDDRIAGSDLIWKVGINKGVRLLETEQRYAINNNVALTGGFVYGRIYNVNEDSDVFHVVYGGIIYSQKVTENIDVYAKYIKGAEFDDLKVGSTCSMDKPAYMGWNYRNLKIKDAVILNGFGVEIGYKF